MWYIKIVLKISSVSTISCGYLPADSELDPKQISLLANGDTIAKICKGSVEPIITTWFVTVEDCGIRRYVGGLYLSFGPGMLFKKAGALVIWEDSFLSDVETGGRGLDQWFHLNRALVGAVSCRWLWLRVRRHWRVLKGILMLVVFVETMMEKVKIGP